MSNSTSKPGFRTNYASSIVVTLELRNKSSHNISQTTHSKNISEENRNQVNQKFLHEFNVNKNYKIKYYLMKLVIF